MKEEEISRQRGEEFFFFFFFFGVLCGTCRKKVNFFLKKMFGGAKQPCGSATASKDKESL
jgi:hypothetical protein